MPNLAFLPLQKEISQFTRNVYLNIKNKKVFVKYLPVMNRLLKCKNKTTVSYESKYFLELLNFVNLVKYEKLTCSSHSKHIIIINSNFKK